MRGEGGAISFAIRLLLGGALISGGLLYAAQSLQKPPASKEPVTEKIGPALTTRQAPQPVRPPSPAPEPTVAAPPAGPAPAAQAAPQARYSTSFAADPAPAAPAAQSQNPAPAAAPSPDDFGVMADEAQPDPGIAQGEPKPQRAAGRGQRGAAGCTQFKSYNPATQTYRSFDGKIKECHP
jgi:hypothetical protein